MLAPKPHPNTLHVDNAVLVVIDMQEPFLRNIFEPERVTANVCALMRGAEILRVPIISTTQYAEKMGDVIPAVKELLPPLLPPYDKIGFSCCSSPSFRSEVQRAGRKQILLCGVESHICVNQTAHELIAIGFQVHIVTDAISSRSKANYKLGIDKMRQGGAILSSVETALYELLHEAGTPEFRDILKIIK